MLTSFDHATVFVRDLSRAVHAYQALLGLAPAWRGLHPDLGTESALFGFSNGLLELVCPIEGDERAEGLRTRLSDVGEGLGALAFGTDNAEACHEWLAQRGVKAAPVEHGVARSHAGVERSYRTVELSPRGSRGVPLLVVERSDRTRLLVQEVPSGAVVEAIDHVVISTANSDAAAAYYGGALGLRLALDRELKGNRMLFFRTGGVTIEVVGGLNDPERDRLYGLAYRVADLDSAHARMAAAGVDVSELRSGNKSGTRVFSVRDGTCGVPTLVLSDPARGSIAPPSAPPELASEDEPDEPDELDDPDTQPDAEPESE